MKKIIFGFLAGLFMISGVSFGSPVVTNDSIPSSPPQATVNTGPIYVTAMKPDGTTIPGATITININGEDYSGNTNQDGMATIKIPEGATTGSIVGRDKYNNFRYLENFTPPPIGQGFIFTLN